MCWLVQSDLRLNEQEKIPNDVKYNFEVHIFVYWDMNKLHVAVFSFSGIILHWNIKHRSKAF